MYTLLHDLGPSYPDSLRPAARLALQRWRDYIIGHKPHADGFELHAVLLDVIESTSVQGLPPNFNRYLYRALDIDIVSGKKVAFVYAKLARILIIGHIAMTPTRQWHGSRISPTGGTFGPRNLVLPAALADYMASKATRLQTLSNELSERQRALVNEDMQKDIDRVANSDLFFAMRHDVEMFGRAAFQHDDDRVT